MSMGDKEKASQTIVQGTTDSAEVDTDGKSTQIRRGRAAGSLKVIEGPGNGTSHPVYAGDNAIGRSDSNRIALDFGDAGIHRECHAWILAKGEKFSVEHGGKTNPVLVNGVAIKGVREINLGDQIKLGTTTLRLDPA